MVDRPAWYPEGYPYPPVGAARSRLPFPIGPTLTLYEAARLVSGRHPYPILPDGITTLGLTTLGPCWGLIAGGSTGATRRRHRPQRGKATFEALQQKVMSSEIPAEMCRLAQPGTISDGGIDWLNVKVHTSDVVHLCKERGWRVRFTCPGSPAGRRRYTVFDKARVMEFLKSCDINNCDEAVKRAEKSLGIDIGQARGRILWKEAGRYRPAGRPRGTRRPVNS